MGIKIPKIVINIGKYEFDKEGFPKFIGRDEEKNRIIRRINPKNKKKYFGAYLVAGNRGMGKTTLVKEAIENINKTSSRLSTKGKKKIIDIDVYLSQGVLSDFDLLKQIFIQLDNNIRYHYRYRTPRNILIPLLIVLSLWSIKFFIVEFNFDEEFNFNTGICYSNILFFASIIPLTIIIVRISKWLIVDIFNGKKNRLFDKLDFVEKRIYSNLELEENSNNHHNTSNDHLFNSIPTLLNKPLGNNSLKQTYSKLTSKELEFEIKIILKLYKEFRYGLNVTGEKRPPVLFVIDELDKLEPEFVEGTEDYLELGKSRLDSRKEAITTLLSNLKSFIHTADAKFIFIGGAEMYDASLADVADRESFYSSIFHEVIYVKSFFKEKASSGTTLTEMIEKYLYNVISDKKNRKPENDSALEPYHYLKKISADIRNVLAEEDTKNPVKVTHQGSPIKHETTIEATRNRKLKAINIVIGLKNGGQLIVESILKTKIPKLEIEKLTVIAEELVSKTTPLTNNISQENKRKLEFISYQLFQYIVYLTYRSNGSPKKLKELIEYELQMPDDRRKKIDNNETIQIHLQKVEKDDLNSSFSFGELRQYEIGFLSNIFMPYLLNNQTHLKLFNDNNLYLSAFLMDHILKFHGAAFSWRQLEILPDIILGGNTPDLRDRLRELINYLSVKHIRETTNAMFQYKFRSNVAMELDFLSKVSDESAAAFNFSFDESYHLKAFFKRKLKQKAQAYRENGFQNTQNSFLQSLSFLNSTIADLHYYDGEYESSIRYYSDSIQQIMNLMMMPETELTNHQEVIYTRNSLLMSLCHERSYHYDLAYSSLREIILNTSSWKFSYDTNIANQTGLFKDNWEAPYKRMQLFLRPHLALLMVIEKDRSDGMTGDNLIRNIHEYAKFLDICDLFPYRNFKADIAFREFLKKEGDHVRIQTLLADYYQSVGSILFYKNTHLKKVFDAGIEGVLGSLLGLKIDHNKVTNTILYKNIKKIRNSNSAAKNLYIPSFESLLYYITSLGHLTLPYLENMEELIGNKHKPEDLLITLSVLSSEKNHMRFSGKQKELLGLVTSKLSDSILSCIHEVDVLKNIDRLKEIDDKDFWKIEDQYDNFISVKSVFYFNILSYKYFYFAGKKYDALTSLMKCLHILRVHFFSTENDKFKHDDSFDTRIFFKKWLIEKCYDIINACDFSSTNKEKSILEKVFPSPSVVPPFKKDTSHLPISNEGLEINMLDDSMTIHLSEDKNTRDEKVTVEAEYKKLNENLYVLKSIFTRFQYLRYAANIYYLKNREFIKKVDFNLINKPQNLNYIPQDEDLSEFCESLDRVESCFDNLFEIMNISGYSYIMSYSYLANFYNNLVTWSKAVDDINTLVKSNDSFDLSEKDKAAIDNWKFKDISDLKAKAIMYFEKAINVHTEGDEYKSFIRKMYILEDDLNDARIHFNAALERSLINVGAISRKLEKLKKQ